MRAFDNDLLPISEKLDGALITVCVPEGEAVLSDGEVW
jgi:hypothetical protein